MSESFNPERELTEPEIAERVAERDRLDDERDAIVVSIEDRRREIRALNVTRKKHEARLRDLRREIRTGTVIESPQTSLGLEVPATDPFEVRYPMPRDFERLHALLAVVLQGVLVPSIEKLEKLAKHPSTGIFQGIAHWTRTELAWMNAKEHPDMQLPSRMPMPELLSELRVYLGRASKPRERAVIVKPAAAKPRRSKGDQVRDSSVKRRGRK